MRASIPSLLLLALVFSDVTVNGLAGAPGWRVAAVIIVAVGAVTPALELERLLLFHRYGVSTCSLAEAQATLSPGQAPTNYMTRSDNLPTWLLRVEPGASGMRTPAGLRRPDRRCRIIPITSICPWVASAMRRFLDLPSVPRPETSGGGPIAADTCQNTPGTRRYRTRVI
jgi:hypothetical protein